MDMESDDYYLILVEKDVNESGIQIYDMDDIKPSERNIIKEECEYLLSEDVEEDTKKTLELTHAFFDVARESNLGKVEVDSSDVKKKLKQEFGYILSEDAEEETRNSIKLEDLLNVTAKSNLDIKSHEIEIEFNNTSYLEDEDDSTSTQKEWEHIFRAYLHTLEKRGKEPPPPIIGRPYKKLSDKTYKCNICGTFSVTESLAIKHYRYKHGEKYHECLACKSTYRRRDTLLFHETNCSAETANILRLARETFNANRKPTLPRKEWKKMKLPCVKCNKLISRRNMSQHKKIHLDPDDLHRKKIRKFACDLCQRTFLCKRSLEAHINAHLDRKPYVCHVCGKAFYSSNILLEHKWIHVSRRFRCDLCDRTYRKKFTLAHHIQTQHPEGLTAYLCNMCGKRIANSTEWHDHMKLHAVVNYPCSDCSKIFTNIASLNGHMKRSHGKQILTRERFLKTLPKLKRVPGVLFDVVKFENLNSTS